VCLG